MAQAGVGFEWDKCIFCQKHRQGYKTNCPANSKRTDIGLGYRTLAETVEGFIILDEIPVEVRPYVNHWNDGDGIESTLLRHRALWHVKCRQTFLHNTRLQRLAESNAAPCTSTNATESDSATEQCSDDTSMLQEGRALRNSSDRAPDQCTPVCFFCSKPGDDLRQVMTFNVLENVLACAQQLNDSMLLARLSPYDMIATNAKYHPPCLLSLYHKADRVSRESNNANNNDHCYTAVDIDVESLALAEVIAYMEDVRVTQVTPPVFKLSDLRKLYTDKLEFLDAPPPEKVHASRFKDRIIENYPGIKAVSQGRDIFLTYDDTVANALKNVCANKDADAVHLMHAAKVIRSQIFSHSWQFHGSLSETKQSLPPLLLTFVNMLLEGPGKETYCRSDAAMSIAQLVSFNAIKRRRQQPDLQLQDGVAIRHSIDRETPLPIYLGLMLHSGMRSKKYIDKCHKLGLSISYDRVMQIINKTTNDVCDNFRKDDLVCPKDLKPGLFTVAAADNIDHNLSSTSAVSSFHGTAVSLMQPVTNGDFSHATTDLPQSFLSASDSVSDIILPSSYNDIMPCILPTSLPIVPPLPVHLVESELDCSEEYMWLDAVKGKIVEEESVNNYSWAAFHAERDERCTLQNPTLSLLPIFKHNANTPAMMKHCLLVIQKAVRSLNPDQCPVVTLDQPLFALVKQIQWQWPVNFGEDNFVILMGGLHIELAALRMLGHWLDGSGWVQCLIQAGFASAGVAESFIGCSHVKRTRHAHVVTAAALYIALQKRYNEYCEQCLDESLLSFSDWRACMKTKSVQFCFWDTVLSLELLVLSFIRSLRLGRFDLYVECLQQLAPWFFVCDQINYARWLSVHLRDMLSLRDAHSEVYDEFMKGNFTISKSARKFSSISIDQAHEQLNAVIKGDGGAIGITENEKALTRWSIAGPQVLRMLGEYEQNLFAKSDNCKHHEQTESFQEKFENDVNKILEVMDYEFIFSETTGNDLIMMCTKTLADEAVVETVKNAERKGKEQFNAFFAERLSESSTLSVMSPLKRNKFPLFSYKPTGNKSNKSILKLSSLKNDCALFSRLYVACQSRDGDLDNFFRHENHPYPPSLSQCGSLNFGTKSDLLDCFKSLVCIQQDLSTLSVDAYVLDGAVIVQMLRPGVCLTFEDYRQKVFVPHVLNYLKKSERVDVVFDVYSTSSLKQLAREKRGTGTRAVVLPNTRIPKNWQEFLRVDDNKTALFHFLADSILPNVLDTRGNVILMTHNENVRIVCGSICTDTIEPCFHDEADTRVILHCRHIAETGYSRVAIRTVDTDVVVLAASFFIKLQLQELWIHFGVGKSVRLIPIHELANAMGPSKCDALLFFHAITGCDTVSCFRGKGKRSAWKAWESSPEVTQVFKDILSVSSLQSNHLAVVERFIIVMYDRTCECSDLSSARKYLFTKKCRSMENLPPTSDALLQHVKRAVFQAAFQWSKALEKDRYECDPEQWGWSKDGSKWQPLWTTLPQVIVSCRELISCKCKNKCGLRCKCQKANLKCTSLCHCDGECYETDDA